MSLLKNIAVVKRNAPPARPLAESSATTSIIPIDLEKRIDTRFQKEKVLVPKTHHKLLRDSIRHKEAKEELRNQHEEEKEKLRNQHKVEKEELRNNLTTLLNNLTTLQTNLTTLSGNLQYLIEVISLCMLRKIDQQEARYGVGHLEVDELTRLLKLDSFHLKELVGEMRQYINRRSEELGVNNQEMQARITKAKLLVEEDLQKLNQTPVDPKMSDSVSVKAGKHVLRCKLIFHTYSTDTEVKEMMKVVDTKFDGSIDDACKEIGFLVVILSTLGIHILPPSFALRDINAEDMKHGLYHFGIRKAKTMAIVDLFHCGDVDEKYMKSLSTVSSNKM